MNDTARSRLTPKAIAGLVLILLGLLFTLDNLGLVDAGTIWEYWPLILIGVGVNRMINPRRPGQRAWGLIEVAAGAFFLLRTLGVFWISLHRVWPVFLVLAGVYVIWQATVERGPGPGGTGAGPGGTGPDLRPPADGPGGGGAQVSGSNRLDEFALCGGGDRVIRDPAFRSGNVTAIMGGFDIDLRECVIAPGGAAIDVFALMGGMVIRVPEDWVVISTVTALFGGVSYRARRSPPTELPVKTLTIRGLVLMGGLEIKN